MLMLWLSIIGFFRAFKDGIKESKEFVYLLFVLLLLLTASTIFYMIVEGWSFLNSLFFVVISVTTVGYGNIVPETKLGIIFTIILILMGVGITVTFLGLLANFALKRQTKTLRSVKHRMSKKNS